MIDACREVGPALFFSLLIITVSFLPVFTLEAQEGRMFKPLAYTKTFAMAGAALLSITLVPVLMLLFIRGKIMPEQKNPVNRFLIWIYRPVIARVMRWKKLTIAAALLALAASVYSGDAAGQRVHAGAERRHRCCTCPRRFRRCPSPRPANCCRPRTRSSRRFPEVASVFGKAGRAADRHRSGAARDVRDGHQPEAAKPNGGRA